MSKIDIPAVPSGFYTATALNDRFQQIEDEFNNKVLYRSDTGAEPNSMQDVLDMGAHKIINLDDGVQDTDAVNIRQVIEVVADAVADLDLSLGNVIGVGPVVSGDLVEYSGTTGRLIRKTDREVNLAADFATLTAQLNKVYTLKGHTVSGIGGGVFIGVSSGTADNGSVFNTLGVKVKRIDPLKTPYEFGYVDGGVDASVAINACTVAYGACYLDGGKTYNIQYSVKPKLLHARGGKATLNCTSPTANTRFGTTGAAVFCSPNATFGDTTATGLIEGVDVRNIIVQCNWLLNATGSASAQSNSLKGFMHYRNDSFINDGCETYNCGSYAFWAVDDSGTGTLYCTGRLSNYYAKDFGVGIECVNTRGVTVDNSHIYISGVLPITTEAMFHTYGGSDMRVVFNNCTGIADGPVNAVFLALLTCKNVAFNNCELLNNYNNGATVQAAVILDPSGTSDFDDINFNNCLLRSLFTSAVNLTIGSSGGTTNSINFTDCEIDGFGTGLAFGGANGGRYSVTACETIARASGVTTPIAIYASNTPTSVQVIGGLAKASTSGSGVPTLTNMSMSIFTGTIFEPAGTQPPKVRQRVVGRGTAGGDGSTYGTFQAFFPTAVVGWTSQTVGTQKVTGTISVDWGQSGAATLAAAMAMSYAFNHGMPSNTQVRFMLPVAALGKTITYEITEWE